MSGPPARPPVSDWKARTRPCRSLAEAGRSRAASPAVQLRDELYRQQIGHRIGGTVQQDTPRFAWSGNRRRLPLTAPRWHIARGQHRVRSRSPACVMGTQPPLRLSPGRVPGTFWDTSCFREAVTAPLWAIRRIRPERPPAGAGGHVSEPLRTISGSPGGTSQARVISHGDVLGGGRKARSTCSMRHLSSMKSRAPLPAGRRTARTPVSLPARVRQTSTDCLWKPVGCVFGTLSYRFR